MILQEKETTKLPKVAFLPKTFLLFSQRVLWVWYMCTFYVKAMPTRTRGWGQPLFMGLKIGVRRDFIAETQKDNTQRCNIFPATPHTPFYAVGSNSGKGFYWWNTKKADFRHKGVSARGLLYGWPTYMDTVYTFCSKLPFFRLTVSIHFDAIWRISKITYLSSNPDLGVRIKCAPWDKGWMDGWDWWLSRTIGLLREPTVLITRNRFSRIVRIPLAWAAN